MQRGRPSKVRFIQHMPKTVQFSPRGAPGRPDEIVLTIDEFEALKLGDYQGYSQVQGAVAMRVSRASFGRILRKARKKVSDAIVNGKSIRIRMGKAQIGVRKKDFKPDIIVQELDQYAKRNQKIREDSLKIPIQMSQEVLE